MQILMMMDKDSKHMIHIQCQSCDPTSDPTI